MSTGEGLMRIRIWGVVAALVWSCPLYVVAAEPAVALPPLPLSPDGQRYFPENLRHQVLHCPTFLTNLPPLTVMDEMREGFISEFLTAMKEPSLSHNERYAAKSGRSVVRFSWMASFRAPVTVRLEWVTSGKMHLVAHMLSSKASRRVDRDLTPAEVGDMNRLFARIGLWNQPSAICDDGLDGSQWLFEGADGAGYHLVRRFSPQNGPVREAGLAMLKLTGWKFKEIY